MIECGIGPLINQGASTHFSPYAGNEGDLGSDFFK